MMSNTSSRRHFLRLGASVAASASLNQLCMMNAHAQAGSDYKALVCIFLYGGHDGHNLLVPQWSSGYATYKAGRGALALPDANTQLLPVTTSGGTPYGLNSGLAAIHPLWAQGKLAVLANVGTLAQPTTRAQYLAGSVPLPTQLFSHPDQQNQMQAGNANAAGGTGWAGRATDQLQALNGGSSFPAAVSMSGQVLFGTGDVVPSASLIPGLDMTGYGMNVWPASATAARAQALQEILTVDSGLTMINKVNQVRKNANSLNALLKNAGSATPLSTVFPNSDLGNQLKQVAQLIQLRQATGMKRQVFFCSLGGFDTHSGQSWQQYDLLLQVGEAMAAFYNATVELGMAQAVTSFTLSDFGRSLQPSGSGSDHGWGNHHLILGGAVKGGNVYGQFPDLTLGGPNDCGRGALIPTTAIEQYGATLAKWYGVSTADGSMAKVFPSLGSPAKFAPADLGFMA